jgi:hypothetical protein
MRGIDFPALVNIGMLRLGAASCRTEKREPNREAGMAYDAGFDQPYWEPWLSMWRTNSLLLVEPWDNALRAFAERAQLLPRRMTTIGLSPGKLARTKPFTVRELVQRCTACESPEQCEWDLRKDPANPAWQAYCPNAATLMALPKSSQFGNSNERTRHK